MMRRLLRRHLPESVTLRRKSPLPVWVQIGWRVGLVLGLLVFAVVVHWIERDGLRDNYDGEVSFLDVIYFTMITITTTGYGDVVPVADHTRMFDALVVTPIRIFFVLIFIGTAYTFVFRRTWDKWQMARLQKRLTGHIVVAGLRDQRRGNGRRTDRSGHPGLKHRRGRLRSGDAGARPRRSAARSCRATPPATGPCRPSMSIGPRRWSSPPAATTPRS